MIEKEETEKAHIENQIDELEMKTLAVEVYVNTESIWHCHIYVNSWQIISLWFTKLYTFHVIIIDDLLILKIAKHDTKKT